MMRMPHRQRGLTMVELLVAVALSVVVALAAVSALVVSRRGFSTVDAASELRDNARFASSMIQRLTTQAGFLDEMFASLRRDKDLGVMLTIPEPNIQGFNNATPNIASNPVVAGTARTGACNTVAGGGCSDILVLRYQAQALTRPANAASVPGSDRSIIDCRGEALPSGPMSRDERGVSILYLGVHQGEPALMCIAGLQVVKADGTSDIVQYDARTTPAWYAPVPIVQGVESFQVLYGTDGVTPLSAPSAANDAVPDRYLRADQLVVSGNAAATNSNWRRVRSVRIGLVLRGQVGSQQESNTDFLYPFGLARKSSGDDLGTFFVPQTSDDDKGTKYTPLNDRRLRHTSTFTVYLHNDQGLCVGETCALE